MYFRYGQYLALDLSLQLARSPMYSLYLFSFFLTPLNSNIEVILNCVLINVRLSIVASWSRLLEQSVESSKFYTWRCQLSTNSS